MYEYGGFSGLRIPALVFLAFVVDEAVSITAVCPCGFSGPDIGLLWAGVCAGGCWTSAVISSTLSSKRQTKAFSTYKHKAGYCFLSIQGQIIKMTIGSVLASWRRSQRRDRLPPSFLLKETEAEPISRSERDKENRSRFPLQLVCCRASEELTFYLSLAISALEAAVFAIQTLRPAQFPPTPAVGCEHAHLCAFTFQENVFPIFILKYGIYRFKQNEVQNYMFYITMTLCCE